MKPQSRRGNRNIQGTLVCGFNSTSPTTALRHSARVVRDEHDPDRMKFQGAEGDGECSEMLQGVL